MSRYSSAPSTLYRRTFGSLCLAVTVVALAAGVVASRVLERHALRELTTSLIRVAGVMEPQVLETLSGSGAASSMQPLAHALGRLADCRVTIIDPQGRVLGDSEKTAESVLQMENHAGRAEVKAALAGTTGSALRYSTTVQYPMLYVAVPLAESSRRVGALRVAVPATVVAQVRRQIRWTIIASLLVGLVMAVAFGAWLTGRVTQPLRRLTHIAKAYAQGAFTSQPPRVAVREIQELSDALSAMAQAVRQHINELTTERNQATAILESMAEGVIALDAHGRILMINPAASVLLHLSGEPKRGQSFFELIRHPELHDLVHAVLQERKRLTNDLVLFQPHQRRVRVHGVPCGQTELSGPCAVLVIQDVTESHRYEQLRREFVANVSHELKSPLTSIRSLTETLLEGAVNDSTSNRRFVELIDQDTARLSRLIDDLLALSQIESQAVPLNLAVIDLQSIATSVTETLQSGITQRGLSVSMKIPPSLAVRADPDRLRQVLLNLIENAVKYNQEHGTIEIAAARNGAWATVTVADTGIGIPTEDLSRIFERFYRVDKTRSRELGGTGLGLSIVKHIVEAHGGRVSVESRSGHGSVFSFTVPLAS